MLFDVVCCVRKARIIKFNVKITIALDRVIIIIVMKLVKLLSLVYMI